MRAAVRAGRARPALRCAVGENRLMFVIKERFFSIGDDFDVLDEHGTKVFHVDGKVLSVRNKVVIEDAAGHEVATLHRHLVALRPTYEIRIGGEKAAEVRKKLLTPFRDKFTIDVPGPDDLEMKGDLLDHEYVIERDGTEVASVSKRWLTIRDTYAVQVSAGVDPLLIIGSVLALDLAMNRDKKKGDDD
ncbi:LURP-one-related/scramblase family protein [Micromonospora trifolii]|uniref:LURP-one-related/scramblase family protein n=1 Tax=Micromonospora trifolii TaxID=2911208 RepID=UPI003D2F4F4A